jgi:hypothetical protein
MGEFKRECANCGFASRASFTVLCASARLVSATFPRVPAFA